METRSNIENTLACTLNKWNDVMVLLALFYGIGDQVVEIFISLDDNMGFNVNLR